MKWAVLACLLLVSSGAMASESYYERAARNAKAKQELEALRAGKGTSVYEQAYPEAALREEAARRGLESLRRSGEARDRLLASTAALRACIAETQAPDGACAKERVLMDLDKQALDTILQTQ